MKEKVFVLDANVLIYDPEAIFKFPRHEVVIPVTVLEELDALKRAPGDRGKSARASIRLLVDLREHGKGNLHDGVVLPNEAIIRVQMEMKVDFDKGLTLSVRDNRIIMSAFLLKEQGRRVIFVSKDFAARVKVQAVGLETEDYQSLKVSYASLAKGVPKVEATKSLIDHFYKDGKVKLPGVTARPNEYCVMKSPEESSAVARYSKEEQAFVSLLHIAGMWGVKPRNVEQKCAVDALLRDDVRLVTLLGPAGTGKTLMALACALFKVFDEGVYHKVLISRPIVPLGRDIGYLPGTKEEKLTTWMQPIFDNLELLCASMSGIEETSDTMRWVMDSRKIEMEAVTYIRGRSLPRMFIIIDEAQNLTPHEVKTIISRAGENSKVVLAGDPTQIDNPYLDQDSNGLVYTTEKFSQHAMHSSIFLEKTERSKLAALAADLM